MESLMIDGKVFRSLVVENALKFLFGIPLHALGGIA